MFGKWTEYYTYRINEFIKESFPYLFTLVILIIGIFSIFIYLKIESKKKIEIPVVKPYSKFEEEKKEEIKPPVENKKEEISPNLKEGKNIYEEIEKNLYEGNYENASETINKNLKENLKDKKLQEYWKKLNNELKVDFKFMYLPKRKGIYEKKEKELELSQKDPYYFDFFISKECYLYLFQLTSKNDLIIHFPSKKVRTRNPVPPGPFRIPDNSTWFYVDDFEGEEKIYLVASLWQNKRIEELIEKINSEREEKFKKELIKELLERIEIEKSSTDKISGLVYGEIKFLNKGG